MRRKIVTILLLMGLAVCATSNNKKDDKTNLTFGAVKSQIVKGATTQSEVIRLLGSPNLTSKNKNNQEVWTYSKTASSSEGSRVTNSAGIFGLLGTANSKAVNTTSVSTFDLIITFTNNDIVDDYSIVTSKF